MTYNDWYAIKPNRWKSKDEIVSDVFLKTLTHGRASVGQPARTYLHQLWADTEYSLEDLTGAMNNRDDKESQGNPYCQCDLIMMIIIY